MQIFSSADSNFSWVVELYRTPTAVTLHDAASFANGLSAGIGLTYLANKGRQYLSCCKSDESIKLADFGHSVALWGHENGHSDFIYLEIVQHETLAVVVKDRVPVFDGYIMQDEVHVLLDNIFGLGSTGSVYVGGKFDPGTVPVSGAEPVERLSVNLNPGFSELRPLSETLKRNVNPLVSLSVVILAVAFVVSLVVFYITEPKNDAPVSPYKSFYSFLNNDSINVLNRANQDYNEQIKLLSLHGWQLKSVTHTRATIAYEVQAKSDGSSEQIGDVASLERYAAINNLAILFEPGKRDSEAVLMAVASNISATQDKRLYRVEQMFRHLKDAIELYIPGAKVEFVREVGQAGGAWKMREIIVALTNHDVRYLNTLGAIIEELPVTLGGERADMQIVKFTVSENGTLTGSIKLTLIGD